MLLAHWSYTKEEWRNFQSWKQKKKGMICYFLYCLRLVKSGESPEIRIASDRVWINDLHKPFHNSNRQFRQINIVEGEKINILAIYYEIKNKVFNIEIPIPKGKLREAIEVEERLLLDNFSVG